MFFFYSFFSIQQPAGVLSYYKALYCAKSMPPRGLGSSHISLACNAFSARLLSSFGFVEFSLNSEQVHLSPTSLQKFRRIFWTPLVPGVLKIKTTVPMAARRCISHQKQVLASKLGSANAACALNHRAIYLSSPVGFILFYGFLFLILLWYRTS